VACDQVNFDIHSKIVIERVWSCIWTPYLSQVADTLGGHDRASFKIRLKAAIKRVSTSTWRQSMDSEPGAET